MTTSIDIVAVIFDFEGESSEVRVHLSVPDHSTISGLSGLASTFGSLLNACTSGKVQNVAVVQRQYLTLGLPTVPGIYPNTEDKMRLGFRGNTTGAQASIQVPCPRDFMFLGDQETVNPASAPVANLVDWILANCVDKAYVSRLSFIGGLRLRNRSKRERAGVASARG